MNTPIPKKVMVALVAAVWLQGFAFAQNLVVNGGFDTDAAGWSATNSTGGYACCKGNPGGCFWLDSTPSPTTDPTVSQVVSGLSPGVSYAVSGDYAKLIDWGGGSASALSFGVAINGVLGYESRQTDFAWHTFLFEFTATSQIATLSISAQRNGTGVSYQIDNIAMQPIPLVTAEVAGRNIALSWPTNAVGFSLQSAANIAAGAWSDVTNAPTVLGSNYTVSLSASSGARFFRLKR